MVQKITGAEGGVRAGEACASPFCRRSGLPPALTGLREPHQIISPRGEGRVAMLSGEQGPLRALGALGGLAFVMAALAVLGWLLGAYLDRRLGTTPWLSIVGTLAGTAAGFFELITVLRRSERTDAGGREK